MKKIKKMVLSLLLFVLIFSQTALACEKNDKNQKTSLTIHAVYDNTAIEGMVFQIYLISTMNEDGTLSIEDYFKDLDKELQIIGKNDDLWKNAAQKVRQKILNDREIQPVTSGTSDHKGTVSFENLKKGLYFVVPCSIQKNKYVYSSSSFFVSLPDKDHEKNEWNDTITVNAKLEQKHLYEDYMVLKIWKDEGSENQRPETIKVHLFCDGKLYDTVKLPQNGRWQYKWSELETFHQWTVTEETVNGYETSAIVQEGNQFTITNTYIQEKTSITDKLPQTGQLWWPVPVLLCGGFFFLSVGLFCMKRNDDEL